MEAHEYDRAHGQTGYTISDEGIDTAAMVYVAPELCFGRCECGGRFRYAGRINTADGEPIEPMTLAQCESCGTGLLSEDG